MTDTGVVHAEPGPVAPTSRALDVRAAAQVVAAFGGVGLVAGLLWLWLAPRVPIQIVSGGADFIDPSPPQFIEADLWFGAIGLVTGVLAGAGVWFWMRRRPLPAVIGIAVGGTLATLIAWRVGLFLGRVDLDAAFRKPVGTIVDAPLQLRAMGMLVVLPMAALAAWVVCDLIGSGTRSEDEADPDLARAPAGQDPWTLPTQSQDPMAWYRPDPDPSAPPPVPTDTPPGPGDDSVG